MQERAVASLLKNYLPTMAEMYCRTGLRYYQISRKQLLYHHIEDYFLLLGMYLLLSIYSELIG